MLLCFLLEEVNPFTILHSFALGSSSLIHSFLHHSSIIHHLLIHPSSHPSIHSSFIIHPSILPPSPSPSLPPFLLLQSFFLPSDKPLYVRAVPPTIIPAPDARFPGLFRVLSPAGIYSRSPPCSPGFLDLLHFVSGSWREAQASCDCMFLRGRKAGLLVPISPGPSWE